jgi:hypothetical protein
MLWDHILWWNFSFNQEEGGGSFILANCWRFQAVLIGIFCPISRRPWPSVESRDEDNFQPRDSCLPGQLRSKAGRYHCKTWVGNVDFAPARRSPLFCRRKLNALRSDQEVVKKSSSLAAEPMYLSACKTNDAYRDLWRVQSPIPAFVYVPARVIKLRVRVHVPVSSTVNPKLQ